MEKALQDKPFTDAKITLDRLEEMIGRLRFRKREAGVGHAQRPPVSYVRYGVAQPSPALVPFNGPYSHPTHPSYPISSRYGNR